MHGLNSHGSRASLWNPPGTGMEPMFPALAGGFLTTRPPVKSPIVLMSSCIPALGFFKSHPFSPYRNFPLLHMLGMGLISVIQNQHNSS